MDFTVTNAVKDTFTTAMKNVPSFIGAVLLWLITCWIPYLNVGTTIALFYAMPVELSKGTVMNPMCIFDGKYRKYMGEFFSIVGLMSVALVPAFCFMIVPGIIISIGWCLAILLLVDKELNPTEAMMESTRRTYGHKWAIFGSNLIISIVWFFAALILGWIAAAIDVTFITIIVYLALIVVAVSLQVSFYGVLYRYLVRMREVPPTTPDML